MEKVSLVVAGGSDMGRVGTRAETPFRLNAIPFEWGSRIGIIIAMM